MSKPPFSVPCDTVPAGTIDGLVVEREMSALPSIVVMDRPAALRDFIAGFARRIRFESLQRGSFFLPTDVFLGKGWSVSRDLITTMIAEAPHCIDLATDRQERPNFYRVDFSKAREPQVPKATMISAA